MTSTIVVEVVETTSDEDTDVAFDADVVEFVDAAAVSDVVKDVLDADDVDVVVFEGADAAIDVESVAVDVVADVIDDVLEKEVVDIAASTDVEEVVVVSTEEGSDVADAMDEEVSVDTVGVVDTDVMEDPVEVVSLWAFAVHPLEIRAATAKKRNSVLNASRAFTIETSLRFILSFLPIYQLRSVVSLLITGMDESSQIQQYVQFESAPLYDLVKSKGDLQGHPLMFAEIAFRCRGRM